jgi:hypothetical protein
MVDSAMVIARRVCLQLSRLLPLFPFDLVSRDFLGISLALRFPFPFDTHWSFKESLVQFLTPAFSRCYQNFITRPPLGKNGMSAGGRFSAHYLVCTMYEAVTRTTTWECDKLRVPELHAMTHPIDDRPDRWMSSCI